ncbi:MAG: ABC transporter ATP-binding protein, partial [Anaeroplasmataceae bacterium]|nr:ABC transporter ATP-binding protein [Anaeroplasmataceae bacterium]
MLRLENIKKSYKVADSEVEALKGIDLSFRKNEFVSILGPSGCGKTTMLNIIGGLDKYSSGDLFINGRSTKEFKDKDWDVYRNHRIGFIFQSYNLIPHQTILGNVELALTIAGLDKEERIARAKKAIDRVGLEGQYNKKPNQLSGGQCQRVAIARALVNEPEILLADEPTGALDTQTSIQIMDLIKEISKEKLVIMVTHNPELAEKYSSRIVRLLDGLVISDSNPYDTQAEIEENTSNKEDNIVIVKEKAKMSFWTAFKLSLKNLFSKKARTILTCVAGSIGIIGVSAVLAVSSGVKGYIKSMQDDMLSGNPVTISENAYDLGAMMSGLSDSEKKEVLEIKDGYINVNSMIERLVKQGNKMAAMQISNNIT